MSSGSAAPRATGEDVVFAASGRVITFHGFLKAYVEGTDDDEREPDDREPGCPREPRATPCTPRRPRRRPRDQAAGALHRGHADQVSSRSGRSAGRRRTPRSSARSSTAATSTRRAPRWCPAWLAFSVIRLLEEHFARQIVLRVHRPHGGRPRRGRGRPADRNTELAEFYFGTGRRRRAQDAGQRPRRDRRPRAGDLPDRRPTASTCGSAATGPTSRARRRRRPNRRANVPDDLPPDELTLEKAKEPAGQPGRRGDPPRHRPRDGPEGRGQERPVRPLRHRGAARGRAQEGRSRAPPRCSSR